MRDPLKGLTDSGSIRTGVSLDRIPPAFSPILADVVRDFNDHREPSWEGAAVAMAGQAPEPDKLRVADASSFCEHMTGTHGRHHGDVDQRLGLQSRVICHRSVDHSDVQLAALDQRQLLRRTELAQRQLRLW